MRYFISLVICAMMGCSDSSASKPLGSTEPVCGSDCMGAPGPTGPQGEKGEQGMMGPAGAAGAPGAAGSPGQKGDVGPQGPMGPQGPVGATGAQGPAGSPGAVGPTGAQGAQGIAGAVGATGAQGPKGATGPTGAVGAQGAAVWIQVPPSAGANPVTIGMAVPVFSGMGVFMTESHGSTGIPNFPEGFVVGLQPTTFHTLCSPDTNAVFIAKTDHVLTNQLVWSGGNTTVLYKIPSNATLETVTCSGSPAFAGYRVTVTSYTFNPVSMDPMSMVLQ